MKCHFVHLVLFILYQGEKYLQEINCGTVKDDGYNNIYDPSVNPQMLAEFSGSAFRSLHSTIVDKVVYVINLNLDFILIPFSNQKYDTKFKYFRYSLLKLIMIINTYHFNIISI